MFIKSRIFFLTDAGYHPILESTRTKYFGSLTRRSEIESGEFSDELKIKGKLQVATRKENFPKGKIQTKGSDVTKRVLQTRNTTRKRERKGSKRLQMSKACKSVEESDHGQV